MLTFYRAGGFGSDTTAIFIASSKAFSALASISAEDPGDQYHRIPHGFECLCSLVCPGLQRTHVIFQFTGLVIKPFRCGLVRRLQCPGPSPERCN
ncbi:hypothetical protein EH61_11770 [Escherichia coli]|nr:hypothetical protein EH61_11770 [Escherichia coli]